MHYVSARVNLLDLVHSLYTHLNPVLSKDEIGRIVELKEHCLFDNIPGLNRVVETLVRWHYTVRGYTVISASSGHYYCNPKL